MSGSRFDDQDQVKNQDELKSPPVGEAASNSLLGIRHTLNVSGSRCGLENNSINVPADRPDDELSHESANNSTNVPDGRPDDVLHSTISPEIYAARVQQVAETNAACSAHIFWTKALKNYSPRAQLIRAENAIRENRRREMESYLETHRQAVRERQLADELAGTAAASASAIVSLFSTDTEPSADRRPSTTDSGVSITAPPPRDEPAN